MPKVGKYDHIIDGLPRILHSDEEYQVKVDAVKGRIQSEGRIVLNANSLAREFSKLRYEKEELEREMSLLDLQIEAIQQLGVEHYENEGTKSLTLDDGSVVRHHAEPYAKVEDREQFRRWCIKEGLERSLSLAWQTTNSLTKELLLKGEPAPPGIKATQKHKFVWNK